MIHQDPCKGTDLFEAIISSSYGKERETKPDQESDMNSNLEDII